MLTKDQLIQSIISEHRKLDKLIDCMSAVEICRKGACGKWSVKDILAHLTEWEALFMEWYRSGVEEYPPKIAPVGMSRRMINTINEKFYLENQQMPLAEVKTRYLRSYGSILMMVRTISEEDLVTQGRFAWTNPYILIDYVIGNTCNHYKWANRMIRNYLRSY